MRETMTKTIPCERCGQPTEALTPGKIIDAASSRVLRITRLPALCGECYVIRYGGFSGCDFPQRPSEPFRHQDRLRQDADEVDAVNHICH